VVCDEHHPYLYYEDLGEAMVWLAKAFGFRRF
jgi:hypothetical protein